MKSTALLVVLAIAAYLPAQSQGVKKYWVYFADKGPSIPSAGSLAKATASIRPATAYLSPRAIARRMKVLPPERLLEAEDLPLHSPYITAVSSTGGEFCRRSKWLNAASFLLTPDQRAAVQRLPFVNRVVPVVAFVGKYRLDESAPLPERLSKTTGLDYGQSLAQVTTINVPKLHEIGISGHNVLVGMLDNGFRWRVHESLKTRRVIAEHDFIFNDDTTANQPGDVSNQDQHGTLTFSTVGGYFGGKLIGPAYDAEFILGKTEDMRSETKAEEDNWAAGIEWMDSAGVDVVSSSLGYNDFDGGSVGDYTWANGSFDGRTTITAIAAVHAARVGIVVCDAMGNEGNGDGTIGTMLTPADADSIISVGAVNYSKILAGFSSTGPTNDARTKPDVVSPGVSVYCASTASASSYFSQNGTSLATPLAAGSAALMLSARPELTPIQVRDALRATAEPLTDVVNFPLSPNNFTGWGLVNAFSAALSFGPIFSNAPAVSVADTTSVVAINVVSKFGLNPASVKIHYAIGASSVYDSIPMTFDSTMFFQSSGRYKVVLPYETLGTIVKFYITASDSASQAYQSPAAALNTVWQLAYGTTDVRPFVVVPEKFALMQNYPNPFNPTTKITFDLARREHVSIIVYNVLGEKVVTLLDAVLDAGTATTRAPVVFDAANLPSGVYFYRIVTPSFIATKKMLLLR